MVKALVSCYLLLLTRRSVLFNRVPSGRVRDGKARRVLRGLSGDTTLQNSQLPVCAVSYFRGYSH